MKSFMFILILIALAATLPFQQHAEAQVMAPNSVVGNGGRVIGNSSHRITGTLGQPTIGEIGNSSHKMLVGFWFIPSRLTGPEETVAEESELSLPKSFALHQNYPNPFNPTTTIQFELPQPSAVTLKLYDLLGREVATLVDQEMESGVHWVNLDAQDLASGVYFYRVQAEGFVRARKLILLK